MAIGLGMAESTSYGPYPGAFLYPAPLDYFAVPPPHRPGPRSKYAFNQYPQQQQHSRKWSHHGQRHDNNQLPSLHQLRSKNFKQAKKHFKGSFGRTPGWTPRSVPPAPDINTPHRFRLTGMTEASPALHNSFHAVTPNPFVPGTAWKNSFSSVDKETALLGATAGFDMLGTNTGLIAKTDDDEWDDDTHQDLGFELHTEETEVSGLPAAARARLEEQSAYIAELEEQNLNLQERLFLLEQELKEVKKHTLPAPVHTDGEEDVAEEDNHDTSSDS